MLTNVFCFHTVESPPQHCFPLWTPFSSRWHRLCSGCGIFISVVLFSTAVVSLILVLSLPLPFYSPCHAVLAIFLIKISIMASIPCDIKLEILSRAFKGCEHFPSRSFFSLSCWLDLIATPIAAAATNTATIVSHT